jgi:Na+-driven multidrug efflux pump
MAFNVLVGNMIGAERIQEAWKYIELAGGVGVAWGLFSGTIMTIFR